MPAIRGDADVLALLDEMGGGGGGTSVAPVAGIVTRPSDGSSAMAASAAASGSDQRTSPHVATLRSAHHLGPPTHPHVELARHRRHEKFKAGFYDLFRACAPPPDAANVRQESNGPSSHSNMEWERTKRIKAMLRMAWTAVPPHSVWERYQFSLKALEAECVREAQGLEGYVPPWCRNADNDAGSLWHRLADPSVRDIYNWMVEGRANGTVWEPLLPVPSIFASSDEGQSHSSHVHEINKKYRRGSMDLLREEIEFQFRRTVKGGGGGGRGNTKGRARGVSLSIDDMYAALKELDEASVRGDTSASEERGKKKKAKKKKKRSKGDDREGGTVDDAVDKEAYVLHAIFASDPFQKLLHKLHRKFHCLAEESYAAFLSDVQKCANRLLVEEQRGPSGGGRKRKRKGGNGGGGMPKIAYVDRDLRNNDDDGNANGEHQLTVTFAGVSLRINASHKDKLHALYRRTLRDLLGREDEIFLRLFPRHLFAILLRYDALEGAGLQSAVPPGMFRFLHTRFGCGWECFASPFNCWFEGSNGRGGRYGSAFGDTDAPFGSAGGFFGMDFLKMAEGTGGCFQANPPFASAFIEKMCNRMNDCLAMANDDDMTRKEKPPLMFVIYVPAWTESTGWKAISLSPHLSRHLLLSQKEDVHYYAEGTQHRRANGEKGTHRIASFDTSVFFLQNNAAREKWPLVEEDDRMLKAAFALSPENSERMESSKGQKQRNDTVAAAKKMKKKKKKAPSKNGNEEGARKKRKLVTGGQEEMNILASMRILEDSTPKEESSKTIGGSKKKKGRRK